MERKKFMIFQEVDIEEEVEGEVDIKTKILIIKRGIKVGV